jgi:sugar phosphate permease
MCRPPRLCEASIRRAAIATMTSIGLVDVDNGNNAGENSLDQHSPGPVDDDASTALVWKIDRHLLPILFVLYLLAFLDRVNLGNARIQGLTQDLHMDGSMYNIASEVLFVPYILLDTPSNILIKKFRPSYYLGGLMFFWGIITVCEGVVSSYAGFIVCRVLLGVFEAGVFPGMKSTRVITILSN